MIYTLAADLNCTHRREEYRLAVYFFLPLASTPVGPFPPISFVYGRVMLDIIFFPYSLYLLLGSWPVHYKGPSLRPGEGLGGDR